MNHSKSSAGRYRGSMNSKAVVPGLADEWRPPRRDNPFLRVGPLQDVDVFGEPIQEADVFVPAPCVSIQVTDEMRRRDAEEQARRAAKPNVTWTRPQAWAETTYTRPAPAKAVRRELKRVINKIRKGDGMKTESSAVRGGWNGGATSNPQSRVPESEALADVKPDALVGQVRIVSRTSLPSPVRPAGRLDRMLIEIAKVPDGMAYEVTCETPKKAVNTLSMLKMKGRAAGAKYVVRGMARGNLCYAWFETLAPQPAEGA
jgi:hypothetical protein